MEQSTLFHEDIYEALRADVQAIGGSKAVGNMFWPEKPVDKAGENLNNCLNTTRNEKLDAEQVMLIIREAKKVTSFCTVTFQNQNTGFAPPQPIEPEDEAAQLQREFINAKNDLGVMLKKMERLHLPTVKAVG